MQVEYRDIAWACKDGVRKGKAHLELKLLRDVKANKKKSLHISTSVAKGRPDKNWGRCSTGKGTYWQRTWKRYSLRYSVLYLPHFLL